MFKPFKVLSSSDPRLANKVDSDDCWVLVETDPNDNVARVISWDDGAPEDQNLVRDYSWVPEILNEYYVNYRVEKETLEKDLQKAVVAAKQTASNMERMERDLYLKLNDKEKEIEDLRDLLHDCADHLEGQFDPEDNLAMMKKIRDFLNKKYE